MRFENQPSPTRTAFLRSRPSPSLGLALAPKSLSGLVAFAAIVLTGCPADDIQQGDTTQADTADTLRQDLSPTPGELGDPCRDGTDCASSLCAPVSGSGSICTQTCESSCPAGYQCVTTDGVSVCADARVANCQPCDADADCNRAGLTGNTCRAYGTDGSFCASACTGDEQCPSGYSCDAGSCRFDEGVCACNAVGIAIGAETTCANTNTFGTCEGSRGCGAGGLTRCMADTPAAETCDGRDNDCDGDTDEALAAATCDLINEFGTCVGTVECTAGRPICVGRAPAAEVCNGADDNCDGNTDEGLADQDEDGKADCIDDDIDGDGSLNPDDCAPLNPAIFPGQTEKCNGIDDNCNREVDEGAAVTAECGCYVCGGLAGCRTSCEDNTDVTTGFVCDSEDFDNDENTTECLPSVCGNGTPEAGEVCDDGLNVGAYGGCLRCEQLGPRCGDSVRQFEFEQCDDGVLNGTPNRCNATCTGITPPDCGNGTIESGETCDNGEGNSNNPNAPCRTDCTPRRCGDGITDNGESCDAAAANGTTTCGCTASCGFPGGTVQCRGSAGQCDSAEFCNGAGACPGDTKLNGNTCRESAGSCDLAEICNGVSNTCPADAKVLAGTTCRESAGICDVVEVCNGTANTCPQNLFAGSERVCRSATDLCDAVETCGGSSAACGADLAVSAGTTCRAGDGTCDPLEACNGQSMACPVNAFTERGVDCSEDADCTDGRCACDGVGMCLPACGNGELDEGEACDDGTLNGQRDRCTSDCQAVCGGEPAWVTPVGGAGRDEATDIVTDDDGAGFVVGTYGPGEGFQGFGIPIGGPPAFFGDFELANRGQDDGFVLGYNPDGTVRWASCISGFDDEEANAVAADRDGVFVVGSFRYDATLACCDADSIPRAPGLGPDGCGYVSSTFFDQSGSPDVYVARWSRDGEFEWVVGGGKEGAWDSANDVATDPVGWAYIVGGFESSFSSNNNTSMFGNLAFQVEGGSDGYVAGFNRLGVGDLAVTIGGSGYEEALSVALDGDDGIYTIVQFDSAFNYGDALIEPVANPEGDMVLLALDRTGAYRWHRVLGEALNLEFDFLDNASVEFGCRLAATADKTCGLHVFADAYTRAWVARFDLEGNLDWSTTIEADGELYAGGLAVERNGRTTISGSFSGLATFGDDTLEANSGGGGGDPLPTSPGFEGQGDIYVARLTADGEWLWAKSFGAGGRDWGDGVGLDDRGAVHVAGAFSEEVGFGDLPPVKATGFEPGFFFSASDGFFGKLVVPDDICFACGNGAVDPGESCDEVDVSSCGGTCNATCDGAANGCGDGLVQCGEDHDFGGGTPDADLCAFVAGQAWCFEVAAVDPVTNNNFTLDPVLPGEKARYGSGVLRENWNQPSIQNPGPFDGLQGNPNQLAVCPTLQVGQVINHKAISAKQWGGDVVTATGTTEGARLYCDGDPGTPPSSIAPANFAAGRNTLAAAIECGDFYEFVSSTGIDVAFEFDNRSAVQGPTNYALYVSISGEDGTWGYAGRAATFQAGDFGSTFIPPITSFDLSTFVAPEGPVALRPEVHFRLYAWGATSVGDPWTLDNVRVGEPLRDEPFRTLFCFEETEDASFTTTPTVERWDSPATFSYGPGLTSPTTVLGPTTTFAGCPTTASTQRAPSAPGWPLSTTFDPGSTAYYAFDLVVPAGAYQVGFTLRRSGTGPVSFAVVSDELGVIEAGRATPTDAATWTHYTYPLTSVDAGPLTFRVYGFGAGATGGTFAIDNFELAPLP